METTSLASLIRTVPDWPKPGILFYDITTLLKDSGGLKSTIDAFSAHYRDVGVDVVLGVEARGFIFAPALAYALGAGFVPVRKPKWPRWRPRSVASCGQPAVCHVPARPE